MSWVLTKDLMPPSGTAVLIVYKDKIHISTLCKSKERKYFALGDYILPVNKISHWMHLPKHPEQQKQVKMGMFL